MPRNVRNFWLDFDIDGRESSMTGGPVSKGGGISGRIYVRDSGNVSAPIRLFGWADRDGTICLEIQIPDDLTVESDPSRPRRIRVRSRR